MLCTLYIKLCNYTCRKQNKKKTFKKNATRYNQEKSKKFFAGAFFVHKQKEIGGGPILWHCGGREKGPVNMVNSNKMKNLKNLEKI